MTGDTAADSPATPPQERLMREAIAAARAGIDAGQTPFGACIARGDEIVAVAHNAVWGQTDPTAHAEIQAIRAACEKLGTIDLSGCVIYSSCEPCPMCFAACHWARLDGIVFGARIADARRAGFNELDIANTQMKSLGQSPLFVVGDFLRDEAARLFQAWSDAGRADAY